MSQMMKFIHLLCCFILSTGLMAKEYHVDGRNDLLGDGSEANPFQTIKQAADIMVAGDVCYIHQGTYREKLKPLHSGKPHKPIIFTAYEDDVVIISATEVISDWELHTENIYKCRDIDLPLDEGNNVFFKGEKMQLARWPNDQDQDEYSLDAKYIDTEEGSYARSFISNQEIPDIDWTGGIIHYLGAHSGCSWERRITQYEADLGRIHFPTLPEKWPFTPHNPYRFENGHRGIFYLMDKIEALDAPGEWFYDREEKVLYFYAPEPLATGKAEVAVRSHTAEIDQKYIHLEDLNFFGDMVALKGNYNRVIRCMVKEGVNKLIVGLKGATYDDAAIQVLEGKGHVIEKCVLENGTHNGVFLSKLTKDCRVENCIIQHFNTVGLHLHLVGSYGKGNRILKNSLYGSARDGVKVTGDNSEFGYNHVQKCLISGADGGLFYVTGNSIPRNIELHHNWFNDAYADVHAGKKATGIYLDNNAAGYIVHHNVVWDVEWGGLHFNWNARKNEIYNNTFWNVGKPEQATIDSWVPERDGVRTNVEGNTLYNNISDVRPWWSSGDGKRYRVDEKEFQGPEADNDFQHNQQFSSAPLESISERNFMPLADKAVVDLGKVVKGITDGYHGAAPDLGAYERGLPYWIPGVDWEPKGFAWVPRSDYLGLD